MGNDLRPEDKIKAWITKYALTQGIFEIDARVCSQVSETMIEDNNQQGLHYHGNDWHRTKEEAIKKAENMRTKKIEFIKKQLVVLENLDFNK